MIFTLDFLKNLLNNPENLAAFISKYHVANKKIKYYDVET